MKNFFVYLVLMTFLSNPLVSYALENSTNDNVELDERAFNIASADVSAGNNILTITKEDKLGKAAIVSLTKGPLNGKTFVIQSAAPGSQGRVIDSDGYTLGKNGTKVQLWQDDKAHDYMHQRWKFVASDKGSDLYYILSMSKAAGKYNYLDASYADLGKNGGKIQLWEDNGGTDNQLWKVTRNSNGTYRIASAHPNAQGRCLDADGYTQGKNGGKVQLWQSLNNKNQEWNLIPQ